MWFPLRAAKDCCGFMDAAFRAASGSAPGVELSLNPLHLTSGTLNEARLYPPRGDERLSVKQKGGSHRGADKAMQKTSDEKKNRKQRAGDIGRALRTIYDDTLRETVPDDFSDLLGKLS